MAFSSPSSCEPGASIMLQAGGACAGFGTCVNSTVDPSRLLCLCHPGYSGASDFFDTRVEQLPDGTFLALTCGESLIGTEIAWSIVGLMGLVRMKQLIPVFWRFFTKYRTDPTHRGFTTDFALMVSTYDLFIVSTAWWILVGAQLARLTLGTDLLGTIMIPLVVFFFNITHYLVTGREFSIFIRSTVSEKQARKAEKFRNGLRMFSLLAYFAINGGGSYWALTTNKSLGPVDNGEYISIIIRNVSTVAWGLSDLLTTAMVRRQILNTLGMTSSSDNGDKPHRSVISRPKSKEGLGDSKGMDLDSRTAQVIKRMETEIRTQIKFLISIGIMYGTFVIPYLYPFQKYSIAFVIGTGALRHCGKSFQQTDQAMKDGAVVDQGHQTSGNHTMVVATNPTAGSYNESVTSGNRE